MLDVDDTVIKTMLPHVQRQYCRHAADQAAALLHSRCDAETPSGAAALARLRSECNLQEREGQNVPVPQRNRRACNHHSALP